MQTYTVKIDSDYSALGEGGTQTKLDGYAVNLATKLSRDFGVSVEVEQALGARGQCIGPNDEIASQIYQAVRDIQGGDGWIDLLPTVNDDDIETMLDSYIETALWSSTDESDDGGGVPLEENYDESDLSDAARASMRKDCADFLEANAAEIGDRFGDAGHDFWLTRNRHGAGFWDRSFWPNQGRTLTEAAHAYGSSDLYVGDDGKLYVS